MVRFDTFDTAAGNDCVNGSQILVDVLDSAGAVVHDETGDGIEWCAATALNLAAGTYYAAVRQVSGGSDLPMYWLEVDFLTDAGTGTEPNDTTAEAMVVAESSFYVSGDCASGTDSDFYAITVPGGYGVRAEVISGDPTLPSCELYTVDPQAMDSILRLYDAEGRLVASADNGNYYCCSILDGTGAAAREDGDLAANLTATEATYFLEVAAGPWAVTGAEVFAYRVAVTIRP